MTSRKKPETDEMPVWTSYPLYDDYWDGPIPVQTKLKIENKNKGGEN